MSASAPETQRPRTSLIADLPSDERPRERLLMHGARSLSDAELLAILLGSGTRGRNAIELARELLADGVGRLAVHDVARLAQTAGVGPAKAARIAAAVEIGRRAGGSEPREIARFDTDVAAAALVRRYTSERQEHLGALFLDSRGRVIRERAIFVGTVDHAIVSARDIVREALDQNAVSVVLYHNHPSGEPAPSAEDLAFTRKVAEALKLVDVKLLDHIVVGGGRYHSMRQKGQL